MKKTNLNLKKLTKNTVGVAALGNPHCEEPALNKCRGDFNRPFFEGILKESNGITLVSLVITIVIMLILAGVAISIAIDPNGLFGQAENATEKWNKAIANESETMDYIFTQIGLVNWEKAKQEAVAPDSQTVNPKTTIGIDAKGEVVNMDLWKFNFDTVTGGYGLQDTIAFTTEASADIRVLEEIPGYRGDFTNVRIPQYISTDNGKTWTAVTNLDWTFYQCTELMQIDNIPDTVVSMKHTFRESKLSNVGKLPSNLQNMHCTFMGTEIASMPEIPGSVSNMVGTFNGCAKLTKTAKLPKGIEDLLKTFQNCILLKQAPLIPEGVKQMDLTFNGCTSLETASTIPSSVNSMIQVYQGCSKLRGNIEINANVTGKEITESDGDVKKDYFGTLKDCTEEGLTLIVSGTCEFIDEIISEANNPRITKAITE